METINEQPDFNSMIRNLASLRSNYELINKKNNVNSQRENKEIKNQEKENTNDINTNNTNIFGQQKKDLTTILFDESEEISCDQFISLSKIKHEIFNLEMKINKLINNDTKIQSDILDISSEKNTFNKEVEENTKMFGGKCKRMQYAMEDMLDELFKIIDNMIPSSVRTLLNTLAQVIENKFKDVKNNDVNLIDNKIKLDIDKIDNIAKKEAPQQAPFISDVISSFRNQIKICCTLNNHKINNTINKNLNNNNFYRYTL